MSILRFFIVFALLVASLTARAAPPESAVSKIPVVMADKPNSFQTEIKSEDILKALGLLGAAIGWILQINAKHLRDKIKADLEILEKSKNLFGDLDERSKRVEVKVNLLMAYLYRDSTPRTPRFISWGDLALALACFAGAAAFGWSWIQSKKYWELSILCVLVFIGIGAILNAFHQGSLDASDT